MLSRETIFTIITRFVVLISSFTLVVISSRFWGDEGRGLIAIIITDVSLIVILNNITAGGTLAFHTPKFDRNKIFSIAFPGVLITTFIGAIIFSLIQGFEYFQYFFIALFISFATATSLYWLGKKNIKLYNIFTLLPPVFIIIYLLLLYYLFGITNIEVFFYAYYLSYGTIWIFGLFSIFRKPRFHWDFDINVAKKVTTYGFKSELSYFIQFLNYRLSYYFISVWLGLSLLGVFSIAIAITEAVWVVSKSISAIHYSNVINTGNPLQRIKMTEKAALNSFVISVLALIVLFFIPETLFTFVFGEDFVGVKALTIYLFPGIIAVAVSNIYGHYFSGIGKMRILIIKSSIGLVATAIFLFLLLRKYGLIGACITLDIAYIASSTYLYIMFLKEKREISQAD